MADITGRNVVQGRRKSGMLKEKKARHREGTGPFFLPTWVREELWW